MKRTVIVVLLIIAIVGGLFLSMNLRAPKAPPPTTQEMWSADGIPVDIAKVISGNMEQAVNVTGDINALHKAELSAKIPGRVAAVYAREGDTVSAGQVVVMLDQQDAQSNLVQAESSLQAAQNALSQAITSAKVTRIQTNAAIESATAGLESAESRLAVVKNPARNQDRMVAENNVASAKANYDRAEADFNRNEKLFKQGAISQSAFDIAKTEYVVAQTSYKSAQQQLSLIKEGGRSEDIQSAQAAVDVAKQELRTAKANAARNLMSNEDIKSAKANVQRTKAMLAMAKEALSYTYVKSPMSGKISMRSTEPGQVVGAGQILSEVVDMSSAYFKGDISEKEIVGVNKGASVDVSVDAIKDTIFPGVVDEVFPSASIESRNFPVRIKILDKTGSIMPGMFARGKIITGYAKNVMLVPKDAVVERTGSKMVFVVEPKTIKVTETNKDGSKGKTTLKDITIVKRHDIEIIREDVDYVQVKPLSDLKVDDLVVTSGRQNLQDMLKVDVRNKK